MKENWVNDKTRILSSNWLPCLRYIFACLWSPSLCKLLRWLLIWFCSHNNIEIPTSQNKKCGFCQFITKSACFVCWNTFKSFIWEIHLQRAKIVQVKCFSSAVVQKAQSIFSLITYVESVTQIYKSNEMEQTCCLADLFHVTLWNFHMFCCASDKLELSRTHGSFFGRRDE